VDRQRDGACGSDRLHLNPAAPQGLAPIGYVSRYHDCMIRSFRCADTQALANGARVRRFVAFERVAQRKLLQLRVSSTLDDLRAPPGNRLEPLSGDRRGQHSIRINDQFRLCFTWSNGGADDVEIVDYH
jgi:toxin HigB-1